jgi:hypothetical protein
MKFGIFIALITLSVTASATETKWAPNPHNDLSSVKTACGAPTAESLGRTNSDPEYGFTRKLKYRKNNFEAWFMGPEKYGSHWEYVDSFKITGDDALSNEEISKRMPCMAKLLPVINPKEAAIAQTSASNQQQKSETPYISLSQGWLLILCVIAIYFIPSIVSKRRKCKAHNGILAINLFLGWTFIGWVISLAWAASGEPMPATITTAQSPTLPR